MTIAAPLHTEPNATASHPNPRLNHILSIHCFLRYLVLPRLAAQFWIWLSLFFPVSWPSSHCHPEANNLSEVQSQNVHSNSPNEQQRVSSTRTDTLKAIDTHWKLSCMLHVK